MLYGRIADCARVEAEQFARSGWSFGLRDATPLLDGIREVCARVGADGVYDQLAEMRIGAAREALDELRGRGFRLGLVSNCTGDIPAVWDETELAPRFDAVVFSCDVRLAKPDARIYRLAAERLGVAPEACLFVDDRPDFAAGAVEAGMGAVVIDPPDGEPEPGRDGRRAQTPADVLAFV